mmetsp:Transcript_6586/g.19865  ORF Transcript_6586/g.19865 Transcript_6586/m.19865 type:complete len:229 (-) Transcript_6586:1209-1895(-)
MPRRGRWRRIARQCCMRSASLLMTSTGSRRPVRIKRRRAGSGGAPSASRRLATASRWRWSWQACVGGRLPSIWTSSLTSRTQLPGKRGWTGRRGAGNAVRRRTSPSAAEALRRRRSSAARAYCFVTRKRRRLVMQRSKKTTATMMMTSSGTMMMTIRMSSWRSSWPLVSMACSSTSAAAAVVQPCQRKPQQALRRHLRLWMRRLCRHLGPCMLRPPRAGADCAQRCGA